MMLCRMALWLVVFTVAALGVACQELPATSPTPPTVAVSPQPPFPTTPAPDPGKPRLYTYEVTKAYPHDPSAFTQGLVHQGGFLYEGTGLYGESSLRRVELETGQVLQQANLPSQYFGEGITVFDDRIMQLTWRSGVGFVYDRDTFRLLSEFYYPTEGWGITHDGARLIMSDGTSVLRFLDPERFNVTGEVIVRDEGVPVARLNELEFINGRVYANVWQTDRIAIIEPSTGAVTGWIDLSGLLESRGPAGRADVLNGIAYDAVADRLLVTGKLWKWLFEITLSEVRR